MARRGLAISQREFMGRKPNPYLAEIASLWIGDRLTWLEQLCLKSFADAGHHTTLYSYKKIENLPDGVHSADASGKFRGVPMYRHAKNR